MSTDDGDENTIQFENGKVTAGSTNDLICRLTPTSEYYPPDDYLFAFILSCRIFIDPVEVLLQVIDRCQSQGEANPDLPHFATVAPHLLLFILQWTETFHNDFRRQEMLEQLHRGFRFCQALDPTLLKSCNQLIQMLDKKLTVNAKRKSQVRISGAFEDRNLVKQVPADTVAAQLTHIELEHICEISCEQMISMLGKDVSPNSKDKSNVQKYVEWFNHLSRFVSCEILAPELGAARNLTMEYYMDVSVSCFSIGNFNSAMAILAGLNQSHLTRLRKLKEKLDLGKSDLLSSLEAQMSPSENFKVYRAALKRASEQHTCVIPFFTLLVKDIHTTSEIKKTKVEGTELINFEKCWEFSRHLRQFQQYQRGVCDLFTDLDIQAQILSSPTMTEEQMAFSSYEIEAPQTKSDMNRYKAFLEKQTQ